MEEAFAFVAPVMPKRTVNPFAVRVAVACAVFVASVGALGVFVVEHERAADARREALAAHQAEVEAARLDEVASKVDVPISVEDLLDQAARDAADEALTLAQASLAETGSFAEASPANLATLGTSLLFVDGPSTAPAVVSVEVTDTAWAAAVQGPGGCAWVVLSADGTIARDIGTTCTGVAAFAAGGTTWAGPV